MLERVYGKRVVVVAGRGNNGADGRAAATALAGRGALVKVLEAGTWFAGRALAAERRSGGGPPITVESDGTVF